MPMTVFNAAYLPFFSCLTQLNHPRKQKQLKRERSQQRRNQSRNQKERYVFNSSYVFSLNFFTSIRAEQVFFIREIVWSTIHC